ncbi:unnamed protein product [Rotaria socialis]|uniref:G-protein coupled receptors family 1 profile domain-containing protein n=1 Tax=Rotaria socialis TaxID=392032 RepID=A0A821H686_9BILA|nr:unnamed protein product [Rotaria socialis]CAF4678414.1 unnamed protein product [Rotaria socialis]
MSSLVNLGGNHNNDANVYALLFNVSQRNFVQTLYTTTYHPNWSISHIPGPPQSSLLTTVKDNLSEDSFYPFWLLILIATFGSITSVLTVLGNILVMLAFFLDRQIRQPTNYFILSLSVSDFLIGLLSMPLLTIYIYAKEWPLNAIICDIWLSLDYTVCLTSIYTVLFITIDRFCSVKMPAKYRKWRTTRRINIMIAMTWAVPTLIFFTSTMLYPRLKGVSNMQNGVCDVQWNKNHVFNLCLIIGYFWTTLLVMIVLYIFIYGVARNLERKSQENARKTSSLVGMAGNTMTQIGVGIGVKKSPTRTLQDKQNHKTDSTTNHTENDQDILQQKILHKQLSSNSSERQPTNDGADDENSNSYESHSDHDFNNTKEKRLHFLNNKISHQVRRGMSVNWGSNSTTAVNLTTSKNQHYRRQFNHKQASNVKSFAYSLYRSPIRLNNLSTTTTTTTTKIKFKQPTNSTQPSITLTPIPSEPELSLCRIHSPPQPRPESLATMSEELFHERLKARHSPFFPTIDPPQHSETIINDHVSANFQSTPSILLNKTSTENINHSDRTITPEMQRENLIEINATSLIFQSELLVKQIASHFDDSSDESWRLLNSNSSLDIPYIDETDFEDLGYILHRRCVPSNDTNEPVYEETIVYKSPLYIKHRDRSKSSLTSITTNNNDNNKGNKIYEIYGNHQDAHKAILESPVFDSVELITYGCTNSNPSYENKPIRHCSLRHVPCDVLLKSGSTSESLPISSNDSNKTSSIIFVSKTKTPLSQNSACLNLSPSTSRHADVERALFDFYQCCQINDTDENLTHSESDLLSNYKEVNKKTSSLLYLNERFSSAFTDDESNCPCNSDLMKIMMLNKTNLDTTSDEQTLTNSVSLNTYSQDFSVDKIFQPFNLNEQLSRNSWISATSSSSSLSQDRQIPQHLFAAIECKRNTSSDSDAITTTTTTLTASTLYGGSDKRKTSEDLKHVGRGPILVKHHSDTFLNENDSSSLNNRIASKVTFESLVTQASVPSSPKTRDQSVMAQIDVRSQINYSTNGHELIENETKSARPSLVNEGTLAGTTSFNSAKSSIKELLQNQKSIHRRKSKSQNRARKALRTITFILGAFVVCWTPWHIYSAVHSLCESCKNNWIFSNPMFHCFYFLCYLNSPINPFCYALANQQFKKTFTRILKLDLRRL